MSEEEFWALIQLSRGGTDSKVILAEQTDNLVRELQELSEVLLADFISIFYKQLWRCYDWDMWAVAYVAYFGCSDDSFEEFRSWLISCGKNNFEQCLSSIDFASRLVLDYFPSKAVGEDSEAFYMAPYTLFKTRFGASVHSRLEPSIYQDETREPAGVPWEECELPERYPSIFNILNRSSEDFRGH
jgi:hypothetical protein